LNGITIKSSVGLGPWALDRGALSPVQKPELDARAIRSAAHYPVQRINFTHKVPFAQATDGWVTGHYAKISEPKSDQQRANSSPSRCVRSLTASVTTPDNNDIICMFHVKQSSLTDAET
jgi:hypothetical protein